MVMLRDFLLCVTEISQHQLCLQDFVVPRQRARYHGFPYTISNQDALKNATTFDLGVSAFRLPPPTWLVIFWGRGILLVFCSTTFCKQGNKNEALL